MNSNFPQPKSSTAALGLIVEGAPEIGELLDAYALQAGFRTADASNGRVELEMYERLEPDLILVEVQTSEMDGWQVLSQLRLRSDTPVVTLKALDEDTAKLQCLRLGADDYVVRPFNEAEVIARGQAILRRTKEVYEIGTHISRVHPFQIYLK